MIEAVSDFRIVKNAIKHIITNTQSLTICRYRLNHDISDVNYTWFFLMSFFISNQARSINFEKKGVWRNIGEGVGVYIAQKVLEEIRSIFLTTYMYM